MQKVRPSKEQYYLDIAKEVAARSTCMSFKCGAIIVNNDQIISTGYNGAPRKTKDCYERGVCLRRKLNIPSGQRYELCRSVHAEQNAVINAARSGVSLNGGDIFLWGMKILNNENKLILMAPCFICKKIIINAGLKRLITHDEKGKILTYNIDDWTTEWANSDMLDDSVKFDAGEYKK